MANRHETTFGSLEVDERYKKLRRSLKLSILEQKYGKTAPEKVSTWPSISSINVDSSVSNFAAPSLQSSFIRSEVLASSNNLRHTLLKKNSHDIKQDKMITSSVRHFQRDSHIDRLVMPPPSKNTVHRAFKIPSYRVCTLPNYEKAESTSLNRSMQSSTNRVSLKGPSSCISNGNTDKEYIYNVDTPTILSDNLMRTFSKWRVMLNDQYELRIKGTLECGRIAHSKPIMRRYSAICVESKYKHKYILLGSIVDERHVLPDYIYGKFYNGFPDDWENVYQVWRTYVSKGCPVTFHWPTPITDSDDDLKSEMTDLTYIHARNNKTVATRRSRNPNEYTKSENLKDTSEKKEKCQNYSTHNSQIYEKHTSSKMSSSFIFNIEQDTIPAEQTKNIKSQYNEDEQSIKTNISSLSSSRKINKFKDIFQEDKVNIIINNLADKNCSPKYIDKVIKMIDCLDYVVSDRTGSENNNDSVISTSNKTIDSKLLQQNLMCDGSRASTSKLENELNSYRHSTDLGYGSIKHDSNTIQRSNSINIKPERDKDLDKTESEIYAGIPKISLERVLKAREVSRNIHRRKAKKKTGYPDVSKHASNLPYNVEEIVSVDAANPIINAKKKINSDSCVSITEDEVEILSDRRKCQNTVNITPRPRETTFSSHREIVQRNDFDVYEERGKSAMHTQDKELKELYDAFKTQRINDFIKEQKIPKRNIQETARSQFVTDVPSDSDVTVVSDVTNTQETDGNTIASYAKVDQDIALISKSNNDFSKKPCASPKSQKKCIEQTKGEIATKKSKPTIISSMPVKLNLTITRADPKLECPYDSKVIVKGIRPKETEKKKSITSIASRPAINDPHSKIVAVETVDCFNDKREICPVTSNKNELNNLNPTNSTTNPTNEQSKNHKPGVKENPKLLTAWTPRVVHYAKSKSELGLIFEGKLLNEVGHVMHRKFRTDMVAKRLSATLIETVNHEFYELLGHLNDDKHAIPKELVAQCRYGCPAKIEKFCLTWETLQHDEVQKVERRGNFDAMMDSLNASVSSRGRRIVPPLCYWTGERITLKDNKPVYNSGNSQESSLLSLTDNSKNNEGTEKEKQQNVKSNNTPRKQNVNKQTLPESNKTSTNNQIVIKKNETPETSPKIKTTDNLRRSSRLSTVSQKFKNKRRLPETLTLTDSSEEEQEISPRKRGRKSTNTASKKRQKIQTSSNKDGIKYRHSDYSPKKKNQKIIYTYYKNSPQSEDFLSEDEISFV